jgi:hypothetical protein
MVAARCVSPDGDRWCARGSLDSVSENGCWFDACPKSVPYKNGCRNERDRVDTVVAMNILRL